MKQSAQLSLRLNPADLALWAALSAAYTQETGDTSPSDAAVFRWMMESLKALLEE